LSDEERFASILLPLVEDGSLKRYSAFSVASVAGAGLAASRKKSGRAGDAALERNAKARATKREKVFYLPLLCAFWYLRSRLIFW
jgi:hypothetical protein